MAGKKYIIVGWDRYEGATTTKLYDKKKQNENKPIHFFCQIIQSYQHTKTSRVGV